MAGIPRWSVLILLPLAVSVATSTNVHDSLMWCAWLAFDMFTIATVYAFFRHGEQHHIAMQYLRGRTPEQVLRERGRLPWREAPAVAVDVALALEHAHALGVVHRDMKPANLMVDAGCGSRVI